MTKTVFATLDASGAPVELFTGQAFTTHHVIVQTQEEAAWSFTAIGEKAASEVNHGPNAIEHYADADLTRYCISKLTIGNAPSGKVLSSYALALANGHITVTPTWINTPAPPVPATVSRMQAKLALNAAGRLDQVEAGVASASREVQLYWAEVSEIHRDHAILAQMTTALGLTSAQVDDLFRAAAQIV